MKILTILAAVFLILGIITFIMAIRYYKSKNVKAVKKELSVVSTKENDMASNVETYRRAGISMPKDSSDDDIKASFLSENRPESLSKPVIQAEEKPQNTNNYGTSALYESIEQREAAPRKRPSSDDTSLLNAKPKKDDNSDTSLLKEKENSTTDETQMLSQAKKYENAEDDDSTTHLGVTPKATNEGSDKTSLLNGSKTFLDDEDNDETTMLHIEESAEF